MTHEQATARIREALWELTEHDEGRMPTLAIAPPSLIWPCREVFSGDGAPESISWYISHDAEHGDPNNAIHAEEVKLRRDFGMTFHLLPGTFAFKRYDGTFAVFALAPLASFPWDRKNSSAA